MNLGIAGCIVLVPVSDSCPEDAEHPPPTTSRILGRILLHIAVTL
jgi:hypothetical protein